MAAFLCVFSLLLLLLLLLLSFHRPIAAIVGSDVGYEAKAEEFTEELLLRPLPDRKLLAHFHFESTAPPSISNGRHHHLFPKAIAQLVKKFHFRELELSFTQGRWNYEKWGGSDPMSSTNAKPPGVELWALFDLPINETDATWKNLAHALSGLFCSSINFLESSTAHSSPDWGFLSNSSNLRYGALPREAVCTENLTPWLKLLPCRDKAGLASLLDRPSIYRGYYHSQRLHLISTKLTGIVLKQSLTVVLQPNVESSHLDSSGGGFLQPSWSISSVFRKKVTGQCILAKASRIFFELERGLAAELEKLGSGDSSHNLFFDLSSTPDRVIKESNVLQGQSTSTLYEFRVANSNGYEPKDVGIRWKLPLTWSCSQAPFHANRFLMGNGNERGFVAISLQSSQSYGWHFDQSSECTVQVTVFQVVPWYVKVYYHTLQIFVDGKPQIVSSVIEKIRVFPSEDKVSPGTLEMKLRFPCNMQSAALVLDFDKGFLHIDEYPPDANQGFDIPSALISFPDFYSSRNYLIDDSLSLSPLLLEFQENNLVRSYTEVLLVPLTTPDFSMPYNVITFTCTVLALYFGSLLNVLRRRVGEEGRLLKCQEMVVPDVDKSLLEQLESMGFPPARATRALHYSGNSSIEAAINWVAEHEDDPDIDQMPLVPINDKKEANKPALTPEEVKLKAQELRERARKKKEEEEKRMEREREKERIRIGKELLEAKRIEEENERKRIMALRKAEKEEEKRAREKIRQRLEEDKAERRRKLGLPPEEPAAPKPASPVAEKKSALPIRPATKAERMRDCLRSLKQNHKDDDAKVKRAFQTLLTYIGNVARNPDEEKFRKIRLNNQAFQDRVGSLQGGIEFLEVCGFEKQAAEELLFLPRDKVDMAVLNSAGSELNSAIANPFFGVL